MKKLNLLTLLIIFIYSCTSTEEAKQAESTTFNQETAIIDQSRWTTLPEEEVSTALASIDFANTAFKLETENIAALYATKGDFRFFPALSRSNAGTLEFYWLAQKGEGAFFPLYANEAPKQSIGLKERSQAFEKTGLLSVAMSSSLKNTLAATERSAILQQFTNPATQERVAYFSMPEANYPTIQENGLTHLGLYELPETISQFSLILGQHQENELDLAGEVFAVKAATIIHLERNDTSLSNLRMENAETTAEYDVSNPCPPCSAGVQ
ncbi:hypothetical protein [Persicobacter diffluens]|uniref:Lipoprotein n=1 Tax=Persicobacter diffluens TaxID=981 RepID=A0AAN4VYF5_9BACT|nr:hypothetical protein PEDI_19180 [Persicobacter diffluens]